MIQYWLETHNTPSEWRNSSKLVIAALLSGSLWCFMGWIGIQKVEATKNYTLKINEYTEKIETLAATDMNKVALYEKNIELQEKALDKFDSTTDSLFTILGPMATAITGYFFVAANTPAVPKPKKIDVEKESDKDKDE